MATQLVGFGLGQQADEFSSYFPKAVPGEAASAEVVKLLRLIRQGSAPDRAKFRQELMKLGGDAVPKLLDELESGNQMFSWNAALILGEIRDPRAVDPLSRVTSEQSRGDPLSASLALGRYDEPAALGPLVVQLLSGKSREARRAAAFAIGGLQMPEGTAKVVEVARDAKQQLDAAAALVALGMSGDVAVIPELAAKMRVTDDRIRRAAVVALALLPACEEAEQIAIARLTDEDPHVVIAALAALATMASQETAMGLTGMPALVSHSDERIRAGVALVVSARAGVESEPFVAKRLVDPSARVRAAAIGGLAAASKPHGDSLAVKGMEDSQHGQVRLASVITLAILAGKRGTQLDLSAFIDDRDAAVRDAALVAHAWLNGPLAKPALVRVMEARREDRLVKRAREILQVLEVSPDLCQRMLRAELQVLLDDTDVAASWAAHKLANEQIIIALGLENALQDLGGGGGEDRTLAAAAKRVPPRLQDLRRHLDAFPYSDHRTSLEVPLLRKREK